MLTVVTGWILLLLGAALGAGGVWLAVLGGSWAYIAIGIGLLVSGVLLVRRRRAGLGVYATLLIATLVWALWEVGLDRWALIPRGAFLAVVGVWLLMPLFSRPLGGAPVADVPTGTGWRCPRGWLASAMVLVVIIATLASMLRDPFDVATVPALVAPTKQGEVYVLDRRTGRPIFPVRESPAPASTTTGELAAPMQPSSAFSFMPPRLTGKDMWGATLWDQLICRIEFRSMRYQGPYTPPSTDRTLVYPGNAGVFNWGGVAVNPVRQVLVGTPALLAFTYRLFPRHDQTTNLVSAGSKEHWNENYGARYAVEIGPFLSPLGVPCQAPPWGAVAGVDLHSGKLAWLHRNGTVRDQMPAWLPIAFPMGVASLGGPLITAGGVMFYSGTLDNYLRAYAVNTGRKLWQARLPAGGQATPMTYRVNDTQMVVVAAGGHGSFGTTIGDAVVAYSLPNRAVAGNTADLEHP
jgi:glucose dehydrogenase